MYNNYEAVGNPVDARVAEHIANKRDQAEVDRKILMVEDYGNDVYLEEQVLRFKKTFNVSSDVNEPRAYTYAAIKIGGVWYLSGPKMGGRAFSWDELVLWLVSGPAPTTFKSVERLFSHGPAGFMKDYLGKPTIKERREFLQETKDNESRVPPLAQNSDLIRLAGPGVEGVETPHTRTAEQFTPEA